MLTELTIRNFKRFDEVVINLDNNVVFIGPNNSGKTTALQAVALWDIGYKKWVEKHGLSNDKKQRPGVAINRRDLVSIPIPNTNLLWRQQHIRKSYIVNGKQQTDNIRVDIIIKGINNGIEWDCGFEFDYANNESFYCRPLRLGSGKNPKRMDVPDISRYSGIAFLPPMSGLADKEHQKQPGEISVLIGQGQTAQVLRNLCYRIFNEEIFSNAWEEVRDHIEVLFGVNLLDPQYYPETAEIVLTYKEKGVEYDLSSSGRGLQQTLLVLTYLYANPNSVLLIDEPDAHLEIIRQREIYHLITEVARKKNSQLIAASHSEVVLNEAAGKDTVIAFVGRPHRLLDRGSQAIKSLKQIGFDQYYQAEHKGWVLYLEDSTDLAILMAYSKLTNHKALKYLDKPFVHYVGNNLSAARSHYYGLKESKNDLKGIAIFDRIDKSLEKSSELEERMWKKREIENYFCFEGIFYRFISKDDPNDLFEAARKEEMEIKMKEAIEEIDKASKIVEKPDIWSDDAKASDDVFHLIFKLFSEKMKLPLILRKNSYYVLVDLLKPEEVHSEIIENLDMIVQVAESACPEM